MSIRIAHLADVHLDRPFAWLAGAEGERARQRLREAFRRCLRIAGERGADLVTIGGDLWEDENVRVDTRRFVAHELERAGIPTLIVCGNHDPYVAGGNYPRTEWPANVTVVDRAAPAHNGFDGVSVWAASWTGAGLDAGFLDGFDARAAAVAEAGEGKPSEAREHRNVLLIHGTSQPIAHFAEESDHCPFDPAAVARAGFDLCLAGHIHRASHRDGVVYPGSPEPLGWGETGEHCVAIVDVGVDVQVELVPVNDHRYEELAVDCEGCATSAEIEARVRAAVDPRRDERLHLRVAIEGEIDKDCLIAPALLAEAVEGGFAELVVDDRSRPAYDLDHLERLETVQGIFVRDLREQIREAADSRERRRLERALRAGLRALDGREDVIRVD